MSMLNQQIKVEKPELESESFSFLAVVKLTALVLRSDCVLEIKLKRLYI
jgi:hypothetical protein